MKTWLKTLRKRERILQTENRFIPQILIFAPIPRWTSLYQNSLGATLCRDRPWSDVVIACGKGEIDEAVLVIYNYRAAQRKIKEAKRKIVHEVEPEEWVLLKKEK